VWREPSCSERTSTFQEASADYSEHEYPTPPRIRGAPRGYSGFGQNQNPSAEESGLGMAWLRVRGLRFFEVGFRDLAGGEEPKELSEKLGTPRLNQERDNQWDRTKLRVGFEPFPQKEESHSITSEVPCDLTQPMDPFAVYEAPRWR